MPDKQNSRSDDRRWLKDAIKDYIRSRKGKKTNIQDIHGHFKIAITPETVYEMEKDGELIRENYLAEGWNGHHNYKIGEQ